jgi:DNA-3-methyladenine glycosylase II
MFAPDDLGLQNAIMRLYDLPEKPMPKQAEAFAERWAPHRSTACRYLWKIPRQYAEIAPWQHKQVYW